MMSETSGFSIVNQQVLNKQFIEFKEIMYFKKTTLDLVLWSN